MARAVPVFYDCEASALEGFPIEIGWACADAKTGAITSESHLILPPAHWPIEEMWDPDAEKLHGIRLSQLRLNGEPVREVAGRMNRFLDGRELFSDDPHDEAWLWLIFEAAGLEPAFTIPRLDAKTLIAALATERGMDAAALARAKAAAARTRAAPAPCRSRCSQFGGPLEYSRAGNLGAMMATGKVDGQGPRPEGCGGPVRYEKAETILRIALDMQGTAEGLSLDDIGRHYSDKPLSRRTAERLRDAIERVFPQVQQANPGELPKRWRLPAATVSGLATITADELADLTTAVTVLRRDNMLTQAENAERVISKLRALLKTAVMTRIDPDLEALTEAEGLAMRPGPKPKINADVVSALRQAILATKKVRIHYLYRGSGKRGFDIVHPYGFLYGNRHYLVAWSENEEARDFRNFSLSNIERVELLDRPFRKRRFSLREYAERSFGVFQEKPFNVVWKFSPKAAPDAKEFLFHPTQKMEERPGGELVVRFRAGGALEMAWHLFTWGENVEVIAPKRLIRAFAQAPRSAETLGQVAAKHSRFAGLGEKETEDI